MYLDIKVDTIFIILLFIAGRVYVPLTKLRKRKEIVDISLDEKQFQPNMDARGVELHKDSKFFQSWQNFKVSFHLT